jgi:uncharacterized protein (DUF779 family)
MWQAVRIGTFCGLRKCRPVATHIPGIYCALNIKKPMTEKLFTRVIATDSALAQLESLREKFGPVLFFQPGGPNDSSTLMCYALGEFNAGSDEVYLDNLDGMPFYVEHEKFELWKRSQLTIDVVKGTGATDSLDHGTGKHFLTRSRLLSDEENKLLE